MFKSIKRWWKYFTAKLNSSFNEKADPKVQLEQAITEAQEQHRRLKEQAANVIAKEGTGFIVAMRTFDASRPGVAAQAVGIAQGALDLAVDYAINRRQFGAPVSSFQGLRFLLADMAMKVEASRALVYATARYVDSNPKVRPTMYSAMSKCFAGDMAMEVTTDAVQILGGYGYMKEYAVEKYMRDAKLHQIYEGTSEIQRMVIARAMLG